MGISQQLAASRLIQPGVCTSSTRPASPYEGQCIYETDTDMMALWNGSAWRYIASTTATSGTVLQVQSTTVTAQTASTSSSSWADITNLSVSITPKSSTSKVFVMVNMEVGGNGSADDTYYGLYRDSTILGQGSGGSNNATMVYRFTYDGAGYQTYQTVNLSTNYLDSPASTSSLTYKMRWWTRVGTIYLNRRGDTTVGASSTITVMEIAG